MPLQIYVDLNGKGLKSYHIYRLSKLDPVARDNGTYRYCVVEDRARDKYDGAYNGLFPHEVDDRGVTFYHTRKDGVNVLLMKAMEALVKNSRG